MKTIYEIKKIKSEGFEIEEWIRKQKAANLPMKHPKKKEENVIQYSSFLSPGKHFFYFMFKNQYIFLSPKYEIVRFKGTNVFLNCIKV
jgi:hypothetical protein